MCLSAKFIIGTSAGTCCLLIEMTQELSEQQEEMQKRTVAKQSCLCRMIVKTGAKKHRRQSRTVSLHTSIGRSLPLPMNT